MVRYESPFPPLPVLPTTNVSNLFLHRRPVDAPDFVFQIDADNGRTRTWNAFKAYVGGISAALTAPSQEGALALDRTRDIVGTLGAPSPDYPALLHACFASGVPFCPLSAFAPAPELAQLLADASVTVLFVDAIYLSTALAAAKEAGLSDMRIYILEGEAPGRVSLNELVRRVADRGVKPPPVYSVDERTLAYLLFSSGTSGRPKAVAVSHANILANMTQLALYGQAIGAAGPPPSPDAIPVTLNFMPLHHTYGIGITTTRATLAPTTVVFLRRWNAARGLEIIGRYKVNSISLVPSAALQLLAAARAAGSGADLSSLRSIGSAGSHLPDEVGTQLGAATGSFISQGFGMSEVTLGAILQVPPGTPLAGGARHPGSPIGSVGLMVPGMSARIVGADGADVAPGSPGELWLAGPNIVMGYWRDAAKTAETFVEHEGTRWLRTGDLFRMGETGDLFFVDRQKDTLKVSGMQVSPKELEDALIEHPARLIAEAVVAGVHGFGRTADERVPRAWIVLTPEGAARGKDAVVAELRKWMSQRLSAYKQLRGGIEVVPEIPRNVMGKILRRVLVDEFEAQLKDGKVKAKL